VLVAARGGNGYQFPCYYLGRKIANGYPWKHGEQANHTRIPCEIEYMLND